MNMRGRGYNKRRQHACPVCAGASLSAEFRGMYAAKNVWRAMPCRHEGIRHFAPAAEHVIVDTAKFASSNRNSGLFIPSGEESGICGIARRATPPRECAACHHYLPSRPARLSFRRDAHIAAPCFTFDHVRHEAEVCARDPRPAAAFMPAPAVARFAYRAMFMRPRVFARFMSAKVLYDMLVTLLPSCFKGISCAQ